MEHGLVVWSGQLLAELLTVCSQGGKASCLSNQQQSVLCSLLFSFLMHVSEALLGP